MLYQSNSRWQILYCSRTSEKIENINFKWCRWGTSQSVTSEWTVTTVHTCDRKTARITPMTSITSGKSSRRETNAQLHAKGVLPISHVERHAFHCIPFMVLRDETSYNETGTETVPFSPTAPCSLSFSTPLGSSWCWKPAMTFCGNDEQSSNAYESQSDIKKTTVFTAATIFINVSMANLGIRHRFLTNNGLQFTFRLFHAIFKASKSKPLESTKCYPHSNVQVER